MTEVAFTAVRVQPSHRKKTQMKSSTLRLSTLIAFSALGGAQVWAQTNDISSIAVVSGVTTVTARIGPDAAPINNVVVGNNLAGIAYVAGDLSLDGGPTSIALYTLTGATIPLAGGAADALTGYGTITGTPTPRTIYTDIPAKFTPDSYSGLTFAEDDLGLPSSRQFYMIHHSAGTDYFATIVPRSGTASSVVDLKPMSWQAIGGASGGPADTGLAGYFALAYATYEGNWMYYLRTAGAADFAPAGHTVFGSMIPALASASTDTIDLQTAAGSFGVGGYTALAFSPSAIGGYPTNQFYYLRQDSATGFTILGRLDPTPGNRTISDIANLGGVYSTLTFSADETGTATGGGELWGNTQLYATGTRAATSQSVSFAAIADRALLDGSFTVTPSASSGLAITLTVAPSSTGTATIAAGPGVGEFTVTPTSPGIITLQATQAGQSAPSPVFLANSLQQSFDVPGPVTTLAIPTTVLTAFTAAPTFTPVPVQADTGTGTITYAITAGTLPAGLSLDTATGAITGTPTAATAGADYTITATDSATPAVSSSKTFHLTVNKATPIVSWATPTAITYGTALSATQLDASANVDGSFIYTPVSGTVLGAGSHTLHVAFTPTDTANYNGAPGSVSLTVNKATPIVSWSTPAVIFFGTALSATQLDASASVDGSFIYTPVSGTVLDAGDGQTLHVAFTPADTDNYNDAAGSVALTVSKATPIISWSTPAAIPFGTALSATQLDASASVAGTFVYTPVAGTVLSAGSQTLNVVFTPLASANYNVTSGSVSLAVGSLAATVTLGGLNVTYDGTPKAVTATTTPAGLSVTFTYAGHSTPPTATGVYAVVGTINDSNYAGSATGTLVISPAISTQPANTTVVLGGSATFTVGASGGNAVTYQWQKNGVDVPGATSATLVIGNVQPGDVGYYTVVISSNGTTTTSTLGLLEMTFAGNIAGSAIEVGTEIHHPNGNIYNQVLLTGQAASIKAVPGEMTRISYVDLANDIVQVEFSGAGTLTLSLENSSGPAAPVNYNQPGVTYMKGHASIAITGANSTTNVSVFSVGKSNAVDQTLFRAGTIYNGWADIALLTVATATANGHFGSVLTANASYFRSVGMTGVYAPGVELNGPVYVSDIDASDTANAFLVLGSVSDARITGGDLFQDGGGDVEVSGITTLQFTDGTSSGGVLLPAESNRGTLVTNGVDVTSQLVH